MADYFSPTVVQPTIPNADMTALERLLLTQIFESEAHGEGLYFFAKRSPNDLIRLPIETVRTAIAASDGVESNVTAFVREQLKNIGGDDASIVLDLSRTSWAFIFQDIVKRSRMLGYVTAVTSFTCNKMRPDGFGGMAVLITADAILGKSTNDILEDFLAEAGLDGEDVSPPA